MKNILNENLNLRGKKILLRLDLNVPIKNGYITDTSRIEKVVPTINLLIQKEAKIIIISHIGRPKGKIIEELSLKPLSKKLSEFLNKEVIFNKNKIDENINQDIKKISNGSVMLLENIRFYDGEEKNDKEFSRQISNLGDIYINDAFSCSHRAHASVDGITNFLPSYFGLQIVEEINALKKITSEIKKPITCIIGGSKISTKIGVITNLIKIFDNIIIVGGMANTILREKNFKIGNSLIENNCKQIVEKIFDSAKKYKCNIYYPSDVVVSKSIEKPGNIKNLDQIENDDIILDIGPQTILSIKNVILSSNTVLWNGPAGYFEKPSFENGTKEITKIIADKTYKDKIFSIAGGGETVAAINKFKKLKSFTFVSTAGGAFLEFLEGKKLPGISALDRK